MVGHNKSIKKCRVRNSSFGSGTEGRVYIVDSYIFRLVYPYIQFPLNWKKRNDKNSVSFFLFFFYSNLPQKFLARNSL